MLCRMLARGAGTGATHIRTMLGGGGESSLDFLRNEQKRGRQDPNRKKQQRRERDVREYIEHHSNDGTSNVKTAESLAWKAMGNTSRGMSTRRAAAPLKEPLGEEEEPLLEDREQDEYREGESHPREGGNASRGGWAGSGGDLDLVGLAV